MEGPLDERRLKLEHNACVVQLYSCTLPVHSNLKSLWNFLFHLPHQHYSTPVWKVFAISKSKDQNKNPSFPPFAIRSSCSSSSEQATKEPHPTSLHLHPLRTTLLNPSLVPFPFKITLSFSILRLILVTVLIFSRCSFFFSGNLWSATEDMGSERRVRKELLAAPATMRHDIEAELRRELMIERELAIIRGGAGFSFLFEQPITTLLQRWGFEEGLKVMTRVLHRVLLPGFKDSEILAFMSGLEGGVHGNSTVTKPLPNDGVPPMVITRFQVYLFSAFCVNVTCPIWIILLHLIWCGGIGFIVYLVIESIFPLRLSDFSISRLFVW